VTLTLNGSKEGTGTHADELIGLREWSICNLKGATLAAGSQLCSAIFASSLCMEALLETADPLVGLPVSR
jgi:hypothetical protein